MPFRFKKSESPAKAVRRVYRERVDAALECLHESRRPASIHGARKEIKKLRALFRLVRGEIKGGTYRKGVKKLRAAADCLAAARDARVMLKAFEHLAGKKLPDFSHIERALKKHARREARLFRKHDSVTVAERLLRQANRRVARFKIQRTGWRAIEPGLRQSYQRGRDFCRQVKAQPLPEHFHDWRKQVKDLWYYFCLLQPVCPAVTPAAIKNLEKLGEQLGEDHDLFLLEEFIQKNCPAHDESVALNKLIATRQRKLRSAARRLGTQIYAETSSQFCHRMAAKSGE